MKASHFFLVATLIPNLQYGECSTELHYKAILSHSPTSPKIWSYIISQPFLLSLILQHEFAPNAQFISFSHSVRSVCRGFFLKSSKVQMVPTRAMNFSLTSWGGGEREQNKAANHCRAHDFYTVCCPGAVFILPP